MLKTERGMAKMDKWEISKRVEQHTLLAFAYLWFNFEHYVIWYYEL